MTSPFPGMDPFLEDQVWLEFHDMLLPTIHNFLVPLLRPRYIVRMEERVYLQYESQSRPTLSRPDVTVLRETGRPGSLKAGAPNVATQPVLIPLPLPEEVRETYLEVRLWETHQVVTVIEVLSPTNKHPGWKGAMSTWQSERACC